MDGVQSEPQTVSTGLLARLADMAHAKGDARRLRAALDACGLALLAPKFAEHGVDDSCLSGAGAVRGGGADGVASSVALRLRTT